MHASPLCLLINEPFPWQVMLSSELEGMVIYLPRGHNNIMDDIPF
jgi:hypothetical protein